MKTIGVSLLLLLLFLASCEKHISVISEDELYISLSIDYSSFTKLNQEGNHFEINDRLGIYAYYNNYYYYDTDGDWYAETVIFHNNELSVNNNTGTELSYEGQESWSFSMKYTNPPPYCVDFLAYYPYKSDVTMSDDSHPIFQYNYDISSQEDFMTAHTYYGHTDGSDTENANNFRDEILGIDGSIPLTFKRQLARFSLSYQKPESVTEVITLSKIIIYYSKAPSVYSFGGYNDVTSWGGIESSGEFLKEEICIDVNTSSTPIPDLTYRVPPGTQITKIVSFFGCGADSHVWHPHHPELEANTHYVFNVIINPEESY